MTLYKIEKQKGFVKAIIIILIALIVLGYFGFNVQNIIQSPMVQKNLNYGWSMVSYVWRNYLEAPAIFIWDKVIIGLGWDNLIRLIGGNKAVPDRVLPPATTSQ